MPVNRDTTDMLDRYNNKRHQLWVDHNQSPEWRLANDHKLVLPNPIGIIDEDVYGTKKGPTYEFDYNPWYIHLTTFKDKYNDKSKFHLIIFWRTIAMNIGPFDDPVLERVVRDNPEYWFVVTRKNEEDIFNFFKENEEMTDHTLEFPMVPVADGADGYMDVKSIFQDMGVDKTEKARSGKIMSLRVYLTDKGREDILIENGLNPLLSEKIIVFGEENKIFWFKNYSFIGRADNDGMEKLKKYLFGAWTTEEYINSKNDDDKLQMLRPFSLRARDNKELNDDVKKLIGKFGGKKKKKTIRKNRKRKRNRKTKRK